ncbi:2Fe-2S ferredoxin-like protein [Escherichia coli]|nr:2Fe-2S ferredoxin-like protein [Escherichia coli]
MARVTLRITGTQLLCRDEHPSLLAALESHNVAVEYQCREGYCGSCRTRLVAGRVDWIAEPLAFIQPGKFCPVVAGQKAILKSSCDRVLAPDTTLTRIIWPTTITWRSNTLSPAPSPL